MVPEVEVDERATCPGGPTRHCRPRTVRRRAAATTAVLTAGLVVALTAGCSGAGDHARPLGPGAPGGSGGSGPATDPSGAKHPQAMLLRSYDSCGALLHGLRTHTAAHVTEWGLPGSYGDYVRGSVIVPSAVDRVDASGAAAAPAQPHSTTNTQEHGVGEPDTLVTDGRRVVSISGGVLRVVDAASRRIVGTLDLSMYAGADTAQLLMHGERALVLFGGASMLPAGPVPATPDGGVASPFGGAATTTAVLVDLHATPSLVGTFHTPGGYIAARMVDGTVRLVVRSTPTLKFPVPIRTAKPAQQRATNRKAAEAAPLSAWLPRYTRTADGTSTSTTVPCDAVRHPRDYTGASILTVYTVRLGGDLRHLAPLSIAADGTSAYATARDLYVASTSATTTALHRFDITGTAQPVYLGSGTVPGLVADSYSMSLYRNALRVVSTKESGGHSVSVLYALDADTLRIIGQVGGLGNGEQLHAVRFLGPMAYVVTFKSVDPLYVLDLRDPAHLRTAGELKITGYSDYLHPTSDGRLLGVGQDVHSDGNGNQVVTGLQVSLFDISSDNQPRRLDRITRAHTPSETPIDPHAFLYWSRTGTAVIPIDSWDADESGAALVLHVTSDGLQTVGTIRNPAGSADADGIERTLVIGSSIWTMSGSGLAASDLTSLHRTAWVQFR